MINAFSTAGAVGSPLQRGVGPHRADVAVLFARADSQYKALPGVEVYDRERDARTYDGPWPVVAHPPCRAWGRLRQFANPRPDERNLARLAVAMVREWGGVLEHPAGSTLWPAQRLPRPGARDAFGGWTLAAPQKWWGHKAEKETWFYVVGCEPRDQPELPLVLGEASHVVQSRKREDYRPHITKAEREHTPPDLALWLVELARRCQVRPNAEVTGLGRERSRPDARRPEAARPTGVSDSQRRALEMAAELEKLRARIESAPVAIMDTRDVLGVCAPTEEGFPALYALQGRRVRLVLDEP